MEISPQNIRLRLVRLTFGIRFGSGQARAATKFGEWGSGPSATFQVVPVFLFQFALLGLLFPSGAGVAADQPAPELPGLFVTSQWTSEQGLPENGVNRILQTRDGYLWVTTWNGVARFDGQRIKPIRLRDGIPTTQTVDLAEDGQGNLWISTLNGGLVRYKEGRIQMFTRSNGLPTDSLRSLAVDGSGQLWIGMYPGLARFDGRTFHQSNPYGDGGTNLAWSVGKGKDGAFSAIDGIRRAWLRESDRWVPIPGAPEGAAKPANFLWTRSGHTWAGLFPRGVARLSAQGWEPLPLEACPVGFVWCWLERRDGTLLCGSFERGVWRFDPQEGRFVALTNDRTVQSDGVLSLCEDREGNLWVGGRSQGLIQMQPRWLSPIPGTESMERVSSAAWDSRGRLWCVSGYGVYLSTGPGQWRLVIEEGRKEPGFHPIAILPDSAGGVWVASRDAGILHCRPELKNPFETVWGGDLVGRLPERGAYSMVGDGADGLWFGTAAGGLGHITDHTVQLFALPQSFEGRKVVALARTPQGDIWAGSEGGGLCRFANGAVLDHFTTAQGLPINSIRALHLDGEGTLWVGTYGGGLVRIRDGRAFTFDSGHGLPDDMISAVLEDSSGFLWCSANPGLFRVDKHRLEEVAAGRAHRIDPLLIGRREGLTGSGPVGGASPSAVALPDGSLCFPHVGGLFRFDPKSLHVPASPEAHIDEVWAEGHRFQLAAGSEEWVTLPRGVDRLDIQYTGIHFVAPERLRFRYRLLGADSRWFEAGTERRASYRRLPPGRYTFEVQSAIAEGAWSTLPATVRMELPPFFWQTLWFRLATWLGAGIAVASIIYARIAQLQRRRAQSEDFTRRLFESQENERRRLANELHDGLEQELLLIKNRAHVAAQSTVDPAAARQIQQIEDASTLAIAETRALATSLRPYQLDRLGLTLALKSLAQNVSGSSGIVMHADLDAIDGVFSPSGESHLYRVVQEALKNVVRHSGATEANLTLFRGTREISLLVQDNGRGFDASAAMGRRAEVVGGFGVSNMEERIRILGGTLTLESKPGEGTRVLASIPIPQHP